MKFLYWLCAIAFTLTSLSSAGFYVLHLSTGEHVPRERAVALYRWAIVAALMSFNLWIFKRVFDGIVALFQ